MYKIFSHSSYNGIILSALFLSYTLTSGTSSFAQHVSAIAAVQNSDGALELFVACDGNNGKIYHTWQNQKDGNWPNAWKPYPTTGHNPDNSEHALAAGKDSKGRILFCYISDGIIYAWVAQGIRSSLSTGKNYTFDWRSKTEPNNIKQSKFTFVTIANNADKSVEILALDESGSAWSIKQLRNFEDGKWKFASPKYIGSPTEYGGSKLKSISASNYADGKIALVALAEDGTAYWSSQLVAKAPPMIRVERNFQEGQWSGQWISLGGHDLKEVKAATSSEAQLEVAALGGDNNIYLKYQATGNRSWSEWRPLIFQYPQSTTSTSGYASPIIFNTSNTGRLFLILHMDAGDTQFKGSFGKAVQGPGNGSWPNHIEYYHAPANITDALGGYNPRLFACIPDPKGKLHFFTSTSTGLYLEHFIDYTPDLQSANLSYQNHEHEIPALPQE